MLGYVGLRKRILGVRLICINWRLKFEKHRSTKSLVEQRDKDTESSRSSQWHRYCRITYRMLLSSIDGCICMMEVKPTERSW